MDHLESFIAECDRRTELAKKRLAETQEEISAEVAVKVFRLATLMCSAHLFLSWHGSGDPIYCEGRMLVALIKCHLRYWFHWLVGHNPGTKMQSMNS